MSQHYKSLRRAAVLVLVIVCPLSLLARSSQADDRASYVGGWTLNKELSGRPEAPDPGNRRGGEFGGGPGGGGRPGLGGIGIPGMGGGDRGGPPPDAREMRKRMEALMQEVVQPATHLAISLGPNAITIVDADGRSRTYATNGKKEKHQLVNGTIETKTSWKDGQLKQEMTIVDGVSLTRTFGLIPDAHQLTITIGGERGRPGTQLVYDADASAN